MTWPPNEIAPEAHALQRTQHEKLVLHGLRPSNPDQKKPGQMRSDNDSKMEERAPRAHSQFWQLIIYTQIQAKAPPMSVAVALPEQEIAQQAEVHQQN